MALFQRAPDAGLSRFLPRNVNRPLYATYMDTAYKDRMRSELKSEARALLQMYGPIVGRHFTVNIDAGTISDIRDGSIFAYLSPDWVMSSTPELTAWAPWAPKEQPHFPC